MTQFVAGGAVLFFLVGVFGHLFSARTDRRLRGEPQIASALGAPILAGVDVTTPQGDRVPATGFLGKVRHLLGGDRPWVLPPVATSADEVNRDIRYRRVLARLATGPADVLLLVADDDETGRLAAGQLAELADRLSVPLRVFEFSPDRPTVPDATVSSGVLVVLGAGTRTAWQLVRLAEACADGGQEIIGAVLTHPVRPSEPEKPGPAAEAPEKALAGSA
jgi:hypothetical protein